MTAKAQALELDITAGVANYQGDLQPTFAPFAQAKPILAFLLKQPITKNIYLRGGLSLATVQGDDAKNKSYLYNRNLRFRSRLQELQLAVEYRFIKKEDFPFTPYVFAGAGVFHFNPYTFVDGNKVYLQPLGTEGQGLPQYPEKQLYSLTQFCLLYGGGFKYQVNCNLNVGVEIGQRKLFTDYLDDVSGTFADEEVLLQGHGQLAVDLAFPTRYLDPTIPYPKAGDLRANPKLNDWYNFVGVTIGLRLVDCGTGMFSLGGLLNKKKRNNYQLECPTNVW